MPRMYIVRRLAARPMSIPATLIRVSDLGFIVIVTWAEDRVFMVS